MGSNTWVSQVLAAMCEEESFARFSRSEKGVQDIKNLQFQKGKVERLGQASDKMLFHFYAILQLLMPVLYTFNKYLETGMIIF